MSADPVWTQTARLTALGNVVNSEAMASSTNVLLRGLSKHWGGVGG